MYGSRFDALTRSFAAPRSRRGFLGSLAAIGAGLAGARAAAAQDGCPPGQTPNRKGDCSCPPGTDACPDGCYDLDRDVANCGACGAGCLGGACRKGECRCPAGTETCGGACRSEESYLDDPANCGACGNACPSGVCAAGSCCVPDCAGKTCGAADGCGGTCDGICPDCNVCVGGVICFADQEATTCGTGGRCCGGTCVDPCLPAGTRCQVGSVGCDVSCASCCGGVGLSSGEFVCE